MYYNRAKKQEGAIPLLRRVEGCVLPSLGPFPIAKAARIKNHCFVLFSLLLVIASCDGNNQQEIFRKLNSKDLDEVFEGTYDAGISGNKMYVPLLLNNAANPSGCGSIHFKGFSLYTEKMYALEKILHVKPSHLYNGVLKMPDSVNIKFFQRIWDVEKSH